MGLVKMTLRLWLILVLTAVASAGADKATPGVFEGLRPDGDGAWLLDGPLYEVDLKYFPNHHFDDLAEALPRLKELQVKVIYLLPDRKSAQPSPAPIPAAKTMPSSTGTAATWTSKPSTRNSWPSVRAATAYTTVFSPSRKKLRQAVSGNSAQVG